MSLKHLSPELKHLVSRTVALLGEVLHRELGPTAYRRIENLRAAMAELRSAPEAQAPKILRQHFRRLQSCTKAQRLEVARAFTLMLELMNTCENAYRTHELQKRKTAVVVTGKNPLSLVYVLTAHPTEARSPQNIAVFHQIQTILVRMLAEPYAALESPLRHWLELAWHTHIVRHRTPRVKDEAEHIYSMLFREPVFTSLLDTIAQGVPFSVHSWVGGDKDGHPGVQEKTLLQSWTLSRTAILTGIRQRLKVLETDLARISPSSLSRGLRPLEKSLQGLRVLQSNDGRRVEAWRRQLQEFCRGYMKAFGVLHPELDRLQILLQLFPALVVPLELRESSDVLMTWSSKQRPRLAIEKMLAEVAKISEGTNPRHYARGFIISMAESLAHVQRAAAIQRHVFRGRVALPIIPLFEEASSLAQSNQIVSAILADRSLHQALRRYWDGKLEMMVGYSDSSKEAGVLASRLAIAEALPRLEKLCRRKGVTPVFFHGSGGSTDRGGGSVEDQTAWWPRSALERYKVTVQGEMVERSLATSEIAQSQLRHILESAAQGLTKQAKYRRNPSLENFAAEVSHNYREQITSQWFLEMVEKATPYSYLNMLKIGSRPTKRSNQQLQVAGLRAIPWILCWTQTRVLFPTWWGTGSAWAKCSERERQALRRAFRQEPVFTSYVRSLGFTLAKVELPIWQLYLEQSPMAAADAAHAFQEFQSEFRRARRFFMEVSGQKHFTWSRPWLAESIQLRSPMIHPLNMLQILAEHSHDANLLRVTVTGISAGMLTTG